MKQTILAVLFATLCLWSCAEAICPTGFQEYNRACHFIGPFAVQSRYQADADCRLMGGYLANFESELEYNYTIGELKGKAFDGYWIGGTFNGFNWVWQKTNANGDTVTSVMNFDEPLYRFFGPLEPNNGLFESYIAIMMHRRQTNKMMYSELAFLDTPRGMSYVCEADYRKDFA